MNQSVSLNLTAELNEQKNGVQSVSPFKQPQRWLFIALVVQLLLVIGIFTYHQNSQQATSAQPLLDFDKGSIDKMVIRDANNSVSLQKTGSEWNLPDFKQLPIEQSKLDDLLDKLNGTKLTWPVANTSSSHERFEVTDDKFQRRIAFYQGDKQLGEFLLGTTPGFKKIHLRRANESEVYAVTLNQFDFSVDASSWLDKTLIDVKKVESVTGADYQLQKTGEQWSLVGDESAKVDAFKADEIAKIFTNVEILDLPKETPQGDAKTYTVKADGNEWKYTFIKTADAHFIKRNDKDAFFKIGQSDYEKLVNITKSQLILPPEAATPPAPAPTTPAADAGKK